MKPDDLQRALDPQHYQDRPDRVTGQAPSLGRVARMPGSKRPDGSRSKRKRGSKRRAKHERYGEGSRFEQAGSGSRHRSLLLGLSTLALLILLGVIGIWIWGQMVPSPGQEWSSPVPKKAAPVIATAPKIPSPSKVAALAKVKQALAIRDPALIPSYFRLGGPSSQEVTAFLAGLETTDGVIDHFEWLSSMDVNGLSVDGVLVSFKKADHLRNRLALLTPDAGGKWQIDFDAFARTVTPSWAELDQGADSALVRIYATRDSYFNGPFRDDKQWACYGMTSPDAEILKLGYCKIGSPQARAMDWIFSKEAKIIRATLEIKRVEGSEARQFEITRVLAEDWVAAAKPFDEGFK